MERTTKPLEKVAPHWPGEPTLQSPRQLSKADFLFPTQVPRKAKDLGGGVGWGLLSNTCTYLPW